MIDGNLMLPILRLCSRPLPQTMSKSVGDTRATVVVLSIDLLEFTMLTSLATPELILFYGGIFWQRSRTNADGLHEICDFRMSSVIK